MRNARANFLWAMLLAYGVARVCQLYADRLPTLAIVVLHVVPPALLAAAHGSSLYGRRGMAVFTGLCLGIGVLAESLSLRTGFPFGNYYFTDVMGPKVLQLPLLLALAYLGMGYAAWVLAVLILGDESRPLRGPRILVLPLLAAVIMTAWDLAMDPVWALLDGAWVWRGGGAYFGVPLSNFGGWFLAAYLYYQAFAIYLRMRLPKPLPQPPGLWIPAILLYAACALGNVLVLGQPMSPAAVSDAAGKQWLTADILRACVAVSLLVMLPFAVLAWRRVANFSAIPERSDCLRNPSG